jgi:hypothetical protein
MPRESLTLLDLSDREFLLIVEDAYDADGWADSFEVARRCDLKERRSAAIRLSWLWRNGVVEREHKRDESGNIRYHRNGRVMHSQRWRLTEIGRAYAHGALKARTQQALDKVDDAAMLELTRYVTGRLRTGDPAARWMVNREWRYGTAPRPG